MGLINPKPRFAYDDAADRVYDYIAQRDVDVVERYSTSDGVWNMVAVKNLILSGQPVEGARIGPPDPVKPVKPPVAGPGTVAAPTSAAKSGMTAPVEPRVPAGPTGLSVAQLLALKLSALQTAALKITPIQLTATGVTAAQVAEWGLTAERADALKLTAEQRAVLMPA